MESHDQPQDWLSAADRHSIVTETCQRFRAVQAFSKPTSEQRGVWCDRYAARLGLVGVDGAIVSKWIDAGGWWRGTRRGVQLELRWVRDTVSGRADVEWRALAKKGKWIDGRSATVMNALQDIGVDLSKRLQMRYKAAQEAKRVAAEEREEEAA